MSIYYCSSKICQRIGLPRISTIGLGREAVSSLIRVPRPPARITHFTNFGKLRDESRASRAGWELGGKSERLKTESRAISVIGEGQKTTKSTNPHSNQTGTDSPEILAHLTSLKIFFFCAGVMARPPILRIQASSSLIEELLPGTETFLRVLREVVMEELGIRVQS